MHVLLDLYGVLLDPERTVRGYREKVADLLASRFGGDPVVWRRAHDDAFMSYVNRIGAADWDARGWAEIVDELDAKNILDVLDRAGVVERPAEPLAFSRSLEREAMASADARFPDARPAIARLRSTGHRVHVATGGSETAEAALRGAGLFELVDSLFTGHSQNAPKGRPAYWRPIPGELGASAGDCVLVDDRLDYLDAAASTGIRALLLDRKRSHRSESMPPFVAATVRTLAGVPHWVEAETRLRGNG